MKRLDHYWYSQNPIAWLLLPLAGLFCLISLLRRGFYRVGLLPVRKAAVPVIVVGNISVGGTGKTPLIVHLCRLLRERGLQPAVISRGYGAEAAEYPLRVSADSDPRRVGDEPLLIARRTGCPVAVGPDRIRDVECLVADERPDIILADDGLQHYRLHRDAEIAVVDARRMFGNGFCLPAGPLREPRSRLQGADMVIFNGGGESAVSFRVVGERALSMSSRQGDCDLQAFKNRKVHAIAGIGHPQRFFSSLRAQGIECIPHPFADHHMYQAEQLRFGDGLPVLMTEKDAVKCQGFELTNHWYVPIDIVLSESARQAINKIVQQVCDG